MLLAAVIACLGSFSVATAANYAANSADSFVTAWNQAAASNEASTITITVPAGSDNITLTQEQRAQLNAISGTGNVTVQMADPSGKLVNFNYDLVNGQVSFNDITLSEPLGSDNDIVVTNATDTTTIDGRNIAIEGTNDAANPKTVGATVTSTNGQVGIGDNVSMEKPSPLPARRLTRWTPPRPRQVRPIPGRPTTPTAIPTSRPWSWATTSPCRIP